jgi:hypothetical protein
VIQLLILAIGVGTICAVVDFVVDQYFDGYPSIMKTLREFLIFLAAEVGKELCTAIMIMAAAFLAGAGFTLGAVAIFKVLGA